MTEEAMKALAAGRTPMTPAAVEEVLGEARAAVHAAPSKPGAVSALRAYVVRQLDKIMEGRGIGEGYLARQAIEVEFLRLTSEDLKEVVSGRKPFTDTILEIVLSEARAVVEASPSQLAGVRDLHDYVTEQLRKIVEHRALGGEVSERLRHRRTRKAAPDERSAMKQAIGI